MQGAAADRRRHHEPAPHEPADRSRLSRAGRPRRRRQPCLERDRQPDVARPARRVPPPTSKVDYAPGRRVAQPGRPSSATAISIDQARANRFRPTFDATTVTAPTFTGLRVFDDYDVAELVPYIDWTPFFRTWGIRSRFPEVLTDPEFADAARPLYDDALGDARQDRERPLVPPEGGRRHLAGQRRNRRRRRRHRRVRRRHREPTCSPRCTASASRQHAPATGRTTASPTSSHRSTRGSWTSWACPRW